MKTYKHLYAQIHTSENLFEAFYQARRNKPKTPEMCAFEFRLEESLFALQEELETRVYQPGGYRHFYISEPKRRKVSAAPFRDRVVHHALCNVIEPIFESRFISDSYACRVGKGTHRALKRAQEFLRQNQYVFHGDILKFFVTTQVSLRGAFFCDEAIPAQQFRNDNVGDCFAKIARNDISG